MTVETPSDIAFSPAVKAAQEARGSRTTYARMTDNRPWPDTITPELAAFVEAQNSVFLASASASGQPYIQHRGGPRGFLKILGPRHMGFADFAGNRQYITVGNLSENALICLFLIDYEHARRVKIWGRARVIEGDKALLDALHVEGSRGRVERAIVIEVGAWDVNCPQHIPRLAPV